MEPLSVSLTMFEAVWQKEFKILKGLEDWSLKKQELKQDLLAGCDRRSKQIFISPKIYDFEQLKPEHAKRILANKAAQILCTLEPGKFSWKDKSLELGGSARIKHDYFPTRGNNEYWNRYMEEIQDSTPLDRQPTLEERIDCSNRVVKKMLAEKKFACAYIAAMVAALGSVVGMPWVYC